MVGNSKAVDGYKYWLPYQTCQPRPRVRVSCEVRRVVRTINWMRRLRYLRTALDERKRAAEEYGAELVEAISRVEVRVRRFPWSGPLYVMPEHLSHIQVRRIVVRRYRFSMYYQVSDEEIVVISVAPPGKRPGHWFKRIER